MFRFFPREEKFFDLFIDAAENIRAGARLFKDMMDRGEVSERVVREIFEIEHKGDLITHDIIKKLNTTFITPIDREDIYALAAALDDVIDLIEASADRLILFKIQRPTVEAVAMADYLHRATSEIVTGVTLLKEKKFTNESCIEINRLENEVDRIHKEAIARLFDVEKDPVTILKWKEIYETIEDATDRCEDVANILEGVVLKHA
ncbi:MAG: DUF47 domain-containing protein [Nitrospirae bacterium]|nr:DUF47 domain-containing protein [Nitrospirota bacterium]OGW61383.1 MAG: phosphate transport regulator [Nitrospirae bacterium RBG_16_64_22]